MGTFISALRDCIRIFLVALLITVTKIRKYVSNFPLEKRKGGGVEGGRRKKEGGGGGGSGKKKKKKRKKAAVKTNKKLKQE